MCLLLDEIYVDSKIEYKGNVITGYASNNVEAAKTIQSFMINSTFGRMTEVVKLIPVKNMSRRELFDLTLDVVRFVQMSRFKVLCILSDNNRINQHLFNLFSNTVWFPNPQYPDEIFFFF